jgi:hypothetical protein
MRWMTGVAVLALAACGDGGAEENKAVTSRPATIAAGQYELTSEVTAFSVVDGGRAQINAPVGTRTTDSVCVGTGRPPTAFFSGEGYHCQYDNYYVRRGRINVTLACWRDGLSGNIPMIVDGPFTADTVEFVRDIRTSLDGTGDVQISAHVTGRRTGDCTPAPASAEPANRTG